MANREDLLKVAAAGPLAGFSLGLVLLLLGFVMPPSDGTGVTIDASVFHESFILGSIGELYRLMQKCTWNSACIHCMGYIFFLVSFFIVICFNKLNISRRLPGINVFYCLRHQFKKTLFNDIFFLSLSKAVSW